MKKMNMEIRIVIADDHPIVRQGLKLAIEMETDLKIVGEAGDGRAALTAIEELKPDVAILDVDMPHQDGFQVARELLAKKNAAKIIFLTIHKDEALCQSALDLGAKGFVLKDSAIDDIVTAIREVSRGRTFTSLPVSTQLLKRGGQNGFPNEQEAGLQQLTPTEHRILKMLADYKTSKEIAGELFISPRTVETHRARICQKLDLRGSHALIKYAVRNKSLL